MKQYTKEDLKEIKMLLNDYVVQNDFDFIYNNLHLIGYTCEAIRKTSKPFAKSMNNSDIEYKNIPVYTGKFRLDIVRKYLKDHQIDLDVDDLFNRVIVIHILMKLLKKEFINPLPVEDVNLILMNIELNY